MSRLLDISRRDLSSWVLLALALFLVVLITPDLGQPPEGADPGAGAAPLLPVAVFFYEVLPSLRTWDGSVSIFSFGLLWLAAIGLFYCTWRLSRNRVVSLGAALLISIHPLAMRAVTQPAGVRDIVGMVLLTWLFALNVRPRGRSTRFPNLPPSASSKPVVALMALGVLMAPGFWIVPLILLAMDIPFQREPGRSAFERNWRSYLPHAACLSVGLLLQFLFGASAEEAGVIGGAGGYAGILGSIFFPGSDHGYLVASVATLLLLIACAAGVLEALFDMGRRRLTLPYIAFAGFGGVAALMGSLFSRDATVAGGAWMAFSGFAMVLPVLAWRFMMSLVPEHDVNQHVQNLPHRPTWDEVLQGAHLAPLPELAHVPAGPRLEDWSSHILAPADAALPAVDDAPVASNRDDLNSALERLGMKLPESRGVAESWDADFCRREIEPHLTTSSSVLALLPSRSPYAAMAAALCARMTIVEKGSQGFPGISAFDHVSLFDYDGRFPWPAGDASCDIVLSIGVLSRVRTPELQAALGEFARILTPGGAAVLVFRHMSAEGDDESNPLPADVAADFCREAGLEVESTAEAVEGSYRILARRGVE